MFSSSTLAAISSSTSRSCRHQRHHDLQPVQPVHLVIRFRRPSRHYEHTTLHALAHWQTSPPETSLLTTALTAIVWSSPSGMNIYRRHVGCLSFQVSHRVSQLRGKHASFTSIVRNFNIGWSASSVCCLSFQSLGSFSLSSIAQCDATQTGLLRCKDTTRMWYRLK